MALTNPKIFGLNIKTELADVRNKNTALVNLGINPLDLEIIKGSSNEGMARFDWFSFSRLKTPIYERDTLHAGAKVGGPAVIEQLDSTIVVPPGFSAEVDCHLIIKMQQEV